MASSDCRLRGRPRRAGTRVRPVAGTVSTASDRLPRLMRGSTRPAFVEERLGLTLELSRAESLLECTQLFFDPGRYPRFAAQQLFGGMQGPGRLFGNRLCQGSRLV